MDRQEQELFRRIAELETKQDFYETELNYLNRLFKDLGFENGLSTLKRAAEALAASSVYKD